MTIVKSKISRTKTKIKTLIGRFTIKSRHMKRRKINNNMTIGEIQENQMPNTNLNTRIILLVTMKSLVNKNKFKLNSLVWDRVSLNLSSNNRVRFIIHKLLSLSQPSSQPLRQSLNHFSLRKLHLQSLTVVPRNSNLKTSLILILLLRSSYHHPNRIINSYEIDCLRINLIKDSY